MIKEYKPTNDDEIKIYDEQYYTIKQIAKYLSVTERTILNYMNSGKLVSVKLGTIRRIQGKAVKQFLAEYINK